MIDKIGDHKKRKMPRPQSAQTRNETLMQERAARQVPMAKDPLEKLRLMCLSRGANGILTLGRLFRNMDDNRSGDLCKDEFRKGIRDIGFQLTEQELESLFATFDKDGSGKVCYEEFLRALRVSTFFLKICLPGAFEEGLRRS